MNPNFGEMNDKKTLIMGVKDGFCEDFLKRQLVNRIDHLLFHSPELFLNSSNMDESIVVLFSSIGRGVYYISDKLRITNE